VKDLLYLGVNYIRHHRVKLLVLTLAITLVSWLPIAIQSIVDQTARQLSQRAERTPLVIGAPGSPLELSLGSLYFKAKTPQVMSYGAPARTISIIAACACPAVVTRPCWGRQ
jgi:putative ABC transport system permease protein